MSSAPVPSGLPASLARLSPLLQHLAIAGPFSGVLGAAYHAWLAGHAPDHSVAATHQTIPFAAAFHGRHLAEYFVTPAQLALWWALLLPATVSLLLLVGGLVLMGVRTVRDARRAGGDSPDRAGARPQGRGRGG
jgi:hypothetical protein